MCFLLKLQYASFRKVVEWNSKSVHSGQHSVQVSYEIQYLRILQNLLVKQKEIVIQKTFSRGHLCTASEVLTKEAFDGNITFCLGPISNKNMIKG